jgi:BirA family biotin operon repressor/biotin-[acetyl-CoA-carboxylase] ligase
MPNAPFDPGTWQSRLMAQKIGRRPVILAEVDSTNRLALKLAAEGAPEGTVVIADRQTAGRGRLKRVWQSPPGRNLYLSILLRPAITVAEAAPLTLVAGVAVAETVIAFCPEGVGLKWPNDVLIGGRKVAGILAETRTATGALAVVVGIGINVNMVQEEFDPAHRDLATSLREETGVEYAVSDVAALLCDRFERSYEQFLAQGFEPLRSRWLLFAEMVGRTVRVLFAGQFEEGRVIGIDCDGALLLANPEGGVRRITAGDATVAREP